MGSADPARAQAVFVPISIVASEREQVGQGFEREIASVDGGLVVLRSVWGLDKVSGWVLRWLWRGGGRQFSRSACGSTPACGSEVVSATWSFTWGVAPGWDRVAPSALGAVQGFVEGGADLVDVGADGFVELVAGDLELFGPEGDVGSHFGIDLFGVMGA